MHTRLRQAVRADVPAIQRVRHSVRENVLRSRASIPDQEVVGFIERFGRGWVIVDERDEAVAFAIGDARDGNIWALFVDSGHERRGYGRRLHDEMVAWPRFYLIDSGSHLPVSSCHARPTARLPIM